jgi:hypothetical protein
MKYTTPKSSAFQVSPGFVVSQCKIKWVVGTIEPLPLRNPAAMAALFNLLLAL